MENLKYAFIDIMLLVHREEFFLPFLPGELIICILSLPSVLQTVRSVMSQLTELFLAATALHIHA